MIERWLSIEDQDWFSWRIFKGSWKPDLEDEAKGVGADPMDLFFMDKPFDMGSYK
jgi:hypothetical protein